MAGPEAGPWIWVSRIPPFESRRGYEAGTASDLIAARAASLCVGSLMATALVDGEFREISVFPLVHFLRGHFGCEVVIADRVLVLPVVVKNHEFQLQFFFHIFPPPFSVVSC